MNVVEFDKDGRILSVVTYFEECSTLNDLYPGCLIVSQDRVVSQSSEYVRGQELLARPLSPVTLHGAVLKGVPAGARVWVDEQPYLADGTDIELEIEPVGRYRIRVEFWPYSAIHNLTRYSPMPAIKRAFFCLR